MGQQKLVPLPPSNHFNTRSNMASQINALIRHLHCRIVSTHQTIRQSEEYCTRLQQICMIVKLRTSRTRTKTSLTVRKI